ncbi:hypothetical protein INR49_018970 [Caranx melampygus]|nr:hypothetical protein INR49_018970 [Caranx melampygus]
MSSPMLAEPQRQPSSPSPNLVTFILPQPRMSGGMSLLGLHHRWNWKKYGSGGENGTIRLALVRRFKIQPQSKVTWAAVWKCLCKIFRNHVCFIFPLSVVHWYWRPVVSPPVAPAVLVVVKDVLACLLLFDTQYFFWHLLHHKVHRLYYLFHKEHHSYTATFSLMTEDTSVWEMLTLSFFATLNPALFDCHPLTELLFFITNICLSVEAHSGYEFPWSVHKLVPFGLFGGSQHHDLHHFKFKDTDNRLSLLAGIHHPDTHSALGYEIVCLVVE